MHLCPQCSHGCVCAGDAAPVVVDPPPGGCIHCAACCDHGVSFDVPCAQCDEEIHTSELEELAVQFPNGG